MQSRKPYEIIVIDDGSRDGSLDVLKKFGSAIKLVSRQNKGEAATLNEGVTLASQPLLAFLDADDLWLPDKLKIQQRFLADNPEMEGCFGHLESFFSPELDAEVKRNMACPEQAQPGNCSKCTLLIRRTALERIGLFDPTVSLGFFEWIIRAQEARFAYATLPDTVAKRRLHRGGLSSHPAYKKEMSRVLKAHLDRKRRANA